MTRGFWTKQKLVKLVGMTLVFVALLFLAQKIRVNSMFFSKQPLPQTIGIIFFGAVGYGLNCLILSFSWMRLLGWAGQAGAGFKQCHVIYARTQVAKYIPGNIFQLAGRHIAGKEAGFKHGSMVAAAAYEMIGLLLVSSALSLLSIIFITPDSRISIWNILAVFLCMLFLPFIFFSKPVAKKLGIPQKRVKDLIDGLLPIYSMYLFFCLVSGLILFGLVFSVVPVELSLEAAMGIISIFAISWIAGFLAPGAPAGFGIRETIMVLLLAGYMGESESLYVALAFRMVTVFGDVLFFISTLVISSDFNGVVVKQASSDK